MNQGREMPHLQLDVTDYEDDTTWRWELRDAAGAFLADHEVELDRDAPMARAFFDLPGYLEASAICHNNLAEYLRRSGAAAERVLAHQLAAAAIGFQTGLGELSRWLRNLVNAGLPDAPPAFAEMADAVEELPGVRFRGSSTACLGALPTATQRWPRSGSWQPAPNRPPGRTCPRS